MLVLCCAAAQGVRAAVIRLARRLRANITDALKEITDFHYQMKSIITQHDGWTDATGKGFLGLSVGKSATCCVRR